MILSEYIKGLKEILESNGDLEVVYSVDDEGNSFNEVFFSPSIGHYIFEDREYYDENSILERNEEIDMDEDSTETKLHINAVCVNQEKFMISCNAITEACNKASRNKKSRIQVKNFLTCNAITEACNKASRNKTKIFGKG